MKCSDTFTCWLLALALSWINLINGWMWISYASISDFTAQYYQITLNEVNWISLLYAVIMTVGAIPLIWVIDHYNLKIIMCLAATINFFCALLHVISSIPNLNAQYRYTVLIVGSVLGGIAQPMGLFSTTKLANTWFSEEKKVSANTIASMGNPLGVILSNLFSPAIVHSYSDIPYLNLFNLIPPILGVILVFLAVYLSPAKINLSIIHETISFIKQAKSCIKNLQFCLLAICFGIGLATFTAISTLIQQILCPLGYDNFFAGLCGALFLGLGFPGVMLVGYIVNKTRKTKEIVKWCILLTSIGTVLFSITSTLSNSHVIIAISVSWMGFFGFGAYPLSLQLAADVAYPAGEVISSGVLITISQILGLIIIPVAQIVAVQAPQLSRIAKCSVEDIRSYWIPTTTLAIIGVLNASIFLLKFNNGHECVQLESQRKDDDEVYKSLIIET